MGRHETAKLRCGGEVTCYEDIPKNFASLLKGSMFSANHFLFTENKFTKHEVQSESRAFEVQGLQETDP